MSTLFYYLFPQVRSTEACLARLAARRRQRARWGFFILMIVFWGYICWHLSLFRINPDHQRTTPISGQKSRDQLRPKEAGPEGLASLAKRFSKRILRSTWSEAGWSWVLTSWLWDNVGNCKHCDRIKYPFFVEHLKHSFDKLLVPRLCFKLWNYIWTLLRQFDDRKFWKAILQETSISGQPSYQLKPGQVNRKYIILKTVFYAAMLSCQVNRKDIIL